MNTRTQLSIVQQLSRNRDVFRQLLTGISKEEYIWKTNADSWCLLEIVCHLYDEEREDFRARVKHVLVTPTQPLPSIDPAGWVKERNYIGQHYTKTVDKLLDERTKSVEWLQSLSSPKWGNAYDHPKFGQMSAKMFFSNWLAHDYLHIRQILQLKYDYLKTLSNENLSYAG